MEDNPVIRLKQKLQESRKSLSIARLPEKTKEDFVTLANEGFCGDYGMALREILNGYLEHQYMKTLFFQNIDMKLDSLIGLFAQPEQKDEKPETVRTVDGKNRVIRRYKK